MKAQSMLINHNGTRKINEGDYVVVIQGNLENDGLMVNHDWSFPKESESVEVIALFGGFLANIADIYGDKFLAAIMLHAITERKIRNKENEN